MKKAIVSGGAGFVGSHLCERLIAEGISVICIDNLITGCLENIKGIKSGRFEFIKADITKPVSIKDKIDYCLHLASPASPVDYHNLPLQTLLAGSTGTYNMLNLCLKNKARFLLSSTSEVYGDPKVNPQPEKYLGNVNCIGPRSVYDEAKRFSESLTIVYRRVYNLEVRIARIFNTYGERMRINDGRAIPQFISQALKGYPLTIYGKGEQTRSFCYISDQVQGLFLLLMSDYNSPVNIGNPEEYKIIDIAKKIINITRSKSSIKFCSLPVDDPQVRCPDISLAKKILKWKPYVGLQQGLKNTIEDFKKRIDKEKIGEHR